MRLVTDDSRVVSSRAIFVVTSMGASYLRAALEAKPAAVLAGPEHAADALRLRDELKTTTVVLEAADLLAAQGRLSSVLHGEPSHHLQITGVTGTNGKTSTAFMLYHIWNELEIPAALVGTLGVFWRGRAGNEVELQTGYTTPRAGQLQELLARMVADGVEQVAMEVSSEALALGRLEGTRFARAVFTNLTAEHLDAHGSMDEYFAAKMRLFEMTARDGGDLLIYRAARFVAGLDTTGRVRLCDEPLLEPGELAVPAYFHRINATLALLASGHPEDDPRIRAALQVLPPIPGRYTLVRDPDDGGSRYGIVDYAHSPDGLENVLQAARAEGIRGLICVFGCGGDRDAAKRPLMGAIAARLADAIIITDDNPRGEDPAAIRAAIRAGIDRELEIRDPADAPEVFEIGDRRAAIQAAVDWIHAREELPAVALVAGKGHESVQIFADRREPFSDALVLEESLRARGNQVEVVP